MSLLSSVHISLFVEVYIAQLLLKHKFFTYGFLNHIVDQVIEASHFYVEHSCEICIWFDWKYSCSFQSYSQLSQFDRREDFLPFGEVSLRSHPEDHYCGMQGLKRDEGIQVVCIKYVFKNIFVGLSAGFN